MATKRKTTGKKAGTKAAAAKPWDSENPKGAGEHKHLTPKAKAAAKRAAAAAGRPYPNLVDNMHAAAAAKKK
jgi:hypothetical protein